MKKPEKVNILGVEHTIEYTDKPIPVVVDTGHVAAGQYLGEERKIKMCIEGGLESEGWGTLIHEIMHGIDLSLELKMSHKAIGLMSHALADVFLRNGWLEKIEK